jgi:hypothetical protein
MSYSPCMLWAHLLSKKMSRYEDIHRNSESRSASDEGTLPSSTLRHAIISNIKYFLKLDYCVGLLEILWALIGVCQLGVHVRSIAKHSHDVFVYKIFLSQFVWYVNMKWHHWQINFRHSQRWLYFLRIQDGDMHNDFFEMKWNIFYTKSVKRFWNILNQSSNWEKLIFIAICL